MITKRLKIGAICLLASTAVTPVQAANNTELERKVEALTKRLEQVEGQKSEPVISGAKQGAFRLPGMNTALKVGGYIQADMVHDVRFKNGTYFNAGNTPDDSVTDRSHTLLQAKQSRFNLESTTDVGTGTPLTGFLEMDFMGADSSTNEVFSNSAGLRLRLAYMQYGDFLVGQNWSNFQDYVGYPTLLDISSPAGRVFVRQTQLRFNVGNFAFSLENPETQPISGFSNEAESLGGIGKDELPDFVASWRGGAGGAKGLYQASAVLRKLGVQGTVSGVTYDTSHTGSGINLAGRWKFEDVTLKANAAYGDGIGRYINNGWGNDLRLNADGTSETITSFGVSAAIELDWTVNTASTFSYGHFGNEDGIGAFGTRNLDTYRANLRWTPIQNVMVGAEVMYAVRDFTDGRSGDNTRLQFSARRSF